MPKTKQDRRVTKRRVTMRSVALVPDVKGPNGEDVYAHWEAVDYIRPDFLDEFVAAQRTRWQTVEVSDEPDAGPAGYDGPTYVPAAIGAAPAVGSRGELNGAKRQTVPFDHPLAGTYYPATDCGPNCQHAPEGARVVYVNDQEG